MPFSVRPGELVCDRTTDFLRPVHRFRTTTVTMADGSPRTMIFCVYCRRTVGLIVEEELLAQRAEAANMLSGLENEDALRDTDEQTDEVPVETVPKTAAYTSAEPMIGTYAIRK